VFAQQSLQPKLSHRRYASVSYALQNSTVFKRAQNWVSVSDGSRIVNGSEFHKVGSETAIHLWPYLVVLERGNELYKVTCWCWLAGWLAGWFSIVLQSGVTGLWCLYTADDQGCSMVWGAFWTAWITAASDHRVGLSTYRRESRKIPFWTLVGFSHCFILNVNVGVVTAFLDIPISLVKLPNRNAQLGNLEKSQNW